MARKQRVRPAYNSQGERIYCTCNQIDDGELMYSAFNAGYSAKIALSGLWLFNARYHYACVDITPENAPDTFVCAGCQATESSPQAVVAAVKKIVVKPLKITRTAQLRKMAQQGFAETFEAIFARIASNPQEIVVDPSHHLDVNAFAQQMERALFEAYSDSEECNDQYKVKYRSLQFNLKDNTNLGLRRKLLGIGSELLLADLVRLTAEQMNESIAKKTLEVQKEALKSVFKPAAAPVSPKKVKQQQQTSKDVVKNNKELGFERVFLPPPRRSSNLDDILATISASTSSQSMLPDHSEVEGQQSKKKFKPSTVTKSLDDLISKIDSEPSDRVLPHVSRKSKHIKPKNTASNEYVSSLDNLLSKYSTLIAGAEEDITPLQVEAESWMNTLPSPQIWSGKITMPQINSFQAALSQINGPTIHESLWSTILSGPYIVSGRIQKMEVERYVSQCANQSKLIFVVQFASSSIEFKEFCEYLVLKDRYGVIKAGGSSPIKDFYLVPVKARQVLEFGGLKVDSRSEGRLVGIIIMGTSLDKLMANQKIVPSGSAKAAVPRADFGVSAVRDAGIPDINGVVHRYTDAAIPAYNQYAPMQQMQSMQPSVGVMAAPSDPRNAGNAPLPLDSNLIGRMLAQLLQK